MQRIRITKNTMPDKHWLVYYNDSHIKKHIDLSGCAGSFELTTGYISNDGLRAVGWRYEENGEICYELFNIGHTIMYMPLQPDLGYIIFSLLRLKNPKKEYSVHLKKFEAALNQGGWKTIDRDNGKK